MKTSSSSNTCMQNSASSSSVPTTLLAPTHSINQKEQSSHTDIVGNQSQPLGRPNQSIESITCCNQSNTNPDNQSTNKSCFSLEQSSSLLKGCSRNGRKSTSLYYIGPACCFPPPSANCRGAQVTKPLVFLHSISDRPVCKVTKTKQSLIW